MRAHSMRDNNQILHDQHFYRVDHAPALAKILGDANADA